MNTISPLSGEDDEITALQYVQVNETKSVLIVGSSTGQLLVIDLATFETIHKEKNHISSETCTLAYNN